MEVYELDTSNLINSFVQVAKKVVTSPNDFFENMPREGGYTSPLTFLAISVGIGGIISSLLSFNPLPLLFALIGILFAFVGAGILQFVTQQLFQGVGTYEGTFRVVAYTGVVSILSWIPIIGLLLTLYGFYLQVIGIEKVHNVPKLKAFLAVIITLVIYFLVMVPLGGMIAIGVGR